jgi:hypothetical protein
MSGVRTMTEAEWMTSSDARAMDEYLYRLQSGRVGGLFGAMREQQWRMVPTRKWVLLSCAFCRQFREQTKWQGLQPLIELGEGSSDQLASAGQFAEAVIQVSNAAYGLFASLEEMFPFAGTWGEKQVEKMEHDYWLLREAWCNLLRDIFGNPFRPVTFDPEWRTTTALALAQGIYEERAFDRLPILADALQDAGCDNDDILNHLRDTTTPHVRGCWALDLVLGKE